MAANVPVIEAPSANTRPWHQDVLDAFEEGGVRYLPFVPDKAISKLLDEAAAREAFEPIALTREEEGVGLLAGVHLAGKRGALLMQASGMGNCLNAIGSLTIAQRFPLLAVVTERGGLAEDVSTQVPFGYALPRILRTMGVQCHELEDVSKVAPAVRGAITTAFVSCIPVVLLLTSYVTKGKTR